MFELRKFTQHKGHRIFEPEVCDRPGVIAAAPRLEL